MAPCVPSSPLDPLPGKLSHNRHLCSISPLPGRGSLAKPVRRDKLSSRSIIL